MPEVIKYNTQMCFLGYQQGEDGDLIEVAQKTAEQTEETDQPKLPGFPAPVSLSEEGIYTTKVISGQIHVSRDEFQDLLNAEHLDGWAVFAVRLNK